MTIARITLFAALLVVIASRPVAAQSAEAESLFREGRTLMKAGKIAEACAKLDASERLESSVGTLLNLADCREQNGQLATAWATFVKAAAEARRAGGDAKREKEASRRAKALEPRLSYLTVSVPDTSEVDGLTISRADVSLDPALWNTSAPVDAGTYQITAQAPGREPWSTSVTVTEGQHASVEVPRFKSMVELAPQDATPPPHEAPAKKARRDDPPDERPTTVHRGRFTTLRWIAVGAGVAGLAAVAGGVVRGLAARDLQSQSDAICPGTLCDDPEGQRLNDDARGAALQANVLFAAGGVAVAAAAVLWLVGAPASGEHASLAITPQLEGGQLGLALSRSF